MKKLCLYLLLVSMLSLCGCSVFDSEYVSVEDYVPTVQGSSSSEEKITVRNINSLKQAIRTLISSGDKEGKIVFDAAYDGDPSEDMSKACWQVRTQDALCAYCVESISYDLTKIVTYYEAKLYVNYTDYIENSGKIEHLPYSTGIEMIVTDSLVNGDTKLVMLVDHSSLSAEELENVVIQVYRQNPAVAPREPYVSVNMYSGGSLQRLYEVNLRYGMTADELSQRKAQLDEFSPFDGVDYSSLDDAQRAYIAFEYILSNCSVELESGYSTVYNALIEKKANSEGMALAFVELCSQLELDCRIVYGQRDWKDHCWNIVMLDGDYYHVDVGVAENEDPLSSFMKRDEAFWERYRWDMSSYPACSGELSYSDAISPVAEKDEEELPDEAAVQ